MDKPHIYKITNQVNGKFYYGVHCGNNTENYMGSGVALKSAFAKYGKESFKKDILLWFDTIEEAYEYESVIVNEKMINNPMCYNISTGGLGGRNHSQETKQKISKSISGENHPWWGRKHSEETKKKIGAKSKGRPTAEMMKALQKINKGRTHSKHICPHCGKEGGGPVMFRFHFDNCKFKENK